MSESNMPSSPARPTIVLIHGMWCQPSVWRHWHHLLDAAGYHCLAIRLPGHRPDPDRRTLNLLGKTRLHDYVATARAVIETLPRPPIVIGHSLGGLIAQKLATEVPLAAAVLLNSAAPGAVFPLRPVAVPGIYRHFLHPNLRRQPFRLSDAEARYLVLNKMPANRQQPVLDGLVYESGRVVYEVAFGPLNLMKTNTVDKEVISCPMLSIAGQEDRIVPVSVSRNMAKWYDSRLEYWEYPEHAHWLLGEPGWDSVANRTLKWLEKHTGGHHP